MIDAFATIVWKDKFTTETWSKIRGILTLDSETGEILHYYCPEDDPTATGITAISGILWRPRSILVTWRFNGSVDPPTFHNKTYSENQLVDRDSRINITALGVGIKFSLAKQ